MTTNKNLERGCLTCNGERSELELFPVEDNETLGSLLPPGLLLPLLKVLGAFPWSHLLDVRQGSWSARGRCVKKLVMFGGEGVYLRLSLLSGKNCLHCFLRQFPIILKKHLHPKKRREKKRKNYDNFWMILKIKDKDDENFHSLFFFFVIENTWFSGNCQKSNNTGNG